MAKEDKFDETEAFVPFGEITSRTRLLAVLSGLLEQEDATSRINVLEARAALDKMAENTTVPSGRQLTETKVSWIQRLFSWVAND